MTNFSIDVNQVSMDYANKLNMSYLEQDIVITDQIYSVFDFIFNNYSGKFSQFEFKLKSGE